MRGPLQSFGNGLRHSFAWEILKVGFHVGMGLFGAALPFIAAYAGWVYFFGGGS